MPTAKVRSAIEKHLTALRPKLPTAFPNAPIQSSPGAKQPYQRVDYLDRPPSNTIMGTSTYFEVGQVQVTLCYPMGDGSGDIQARADALRTHFRRGTTLTYGGVQVIVMDTPAQANGLPDGDRYCIPITVAYQAQIET